MDSAKNQLIDKLKSANNVLVTVSRNPSVDQLAALLGLTIVLNKQGKHAAAVFSGEVPSTMEFLKPEDTIEKTTDSLRDFIIALDKSKADKLRYKVEDNVVRIFITPYKTSISQDDLEFSQGDFNVDVVVALGVKQQEDLDEAITTHGRILHDATVASVNVSSQGGLGSINWQDPQASSLSELVTELAQALGDKVLDEQIATALLTGIVAETNRFSNEKTTSMTMSASAALMAAGANQQLVATKLEEGDTIPAQGTGSDGSTSTQKSEDGTLDIAHDEEADSKSDEPSESAAILPEPNFDEPDEPEAGSQNPGLTEGARMITEPPKLGGALTANTAQNEFEPSSDPLSLPSAESPEMLQHESKSRAPTLNPLPTEPQEPAATPAAPAPAKEESSEPEPQAPAGLQNAPSFTPPPANWTPTQPPAAAPAPPAVPAQPANDPMQLPSEPPKDEDTSTDDAGEHTLAELEASVHSPHADPGAIDAARDQVSKALTSSDAPAPSPAPIAALNAQPLGGSLHANDHTTSQPSSGLPTVEVGPDGTFKTQPAGMPPTQPSPQVNDPTAPPPVPPPLPFTTPPNPGQNQ